LFPNVARLLLSLILVISAFMASLSVASAETRTLKMYFTHTKESTTFTFKKNGRYVKSGLRKANRFLRDWRRKEPTRMDPALLDLVWEVYQRSGSRKPIHVISAYRSPRTNNMLRRRGRNVARKSQHTRGKAIDFFLPDVSVSKLRALGLKAHRGGVGYYRGSFVHLDTGRVRHWPRMSRKQLARVFPRGKTIHVPSNGRPLKGYKTAMANLKKGRNADGSRRKTVVRKTLLASIFSGGSSGADEDEAAIVKKTRAVARATPAKKKPAPKPTVVAAAPQPQKAKGPDPFSAESAAAKQARLKQEAEKLAAEKLEAEKLAQETQVAVLVPTRVAVPKRRPNAASTTQVALAPVAENKLAPIRATELALATPPAVRRVLRPAVDVPDASATPSTLTPVPRAQARAVVAPTVPVPAAPLPKQPVRAPVVLAKANPNDVTDLAKRTTSALARGRPAARIPTEAETTSNAILANALKSIPVPKSPAKQKELVQLALANATGSSNQSLAKPQWRSSPSEEQSVKKSAEEPETNLRVPVPTAAPQKPKAVASIATGARTPMVSSLKLGNLDGRSVKKWAVSQSTRVGLSASLRAPNYKQGTNRAVPSSVYSAGFAFKRAPLRADRFSGKSLTRVAFAHFGTRQ